MNGVWWLLVSVCIQFAISESKSQFNIDIPDGVYNYTLTSVTLPNAGNGALVVIGITTENMLIGLSESPDAGGLFIEIEIGGTGNTVSSIRACARCTDLATSTNLLLGSGLSAFWVNVYNNVITVGAGSVPGLGDRSKFMSYNFAGIGYKNVSAYYVSVGAWGKYVNYSSVSTFPSAESTAQDSRYMVRWPLVKDANCTIHTIKGPPVNFVCDGQVKNTGSGTPFTGASMNTNAVHADVPLQPMLTAPSFTAMIWARNQYTFPDLDGGDFHSPLTFRQGHGGTDLKGFCFYCDPTGVLSVWLGVGANGMNWGGVGTRLPCTVNEWIHLAVTYDALTELVVFYVNGRNVGSTTLNFAPADAAFLRLGGGFTEFGPDSGGAWWIGDIAAAAYYNFALSPTSMINEMSDNGPT